MAGASFSIRGEQPTDAAAIASVIARAFDGHPHSNGGEQYIVQALRVAAALPVSLVAVDPRLQRNGMGSALVTTGLAHLRERGAAGCVVLGEPAYYTRFGFANSETLRYPGPPPGYFMALAFDDAPAQGEVSYHAAFESGAPARKV